MSIVIAGTIEAGFMRFSKSKDIKKDRICWIFEYGSYFFAGGRNRCGQFAFLNIGFEKIQDLVGSLWSDRGFH